ncbi:hypothetical protein [Roseomonas indoligenes]|uniref:Uncharacterized protein n=1 Tax=Roseomonas indoligenes TaxID=2820811 RepID=A0A940MXR9_9PROT|nr:hypothetical protein [Pararoseomonas indoligenes]MBP0492759.1 hypothetical protein [Pararoseomonas indoligenes]
MPRRTICRGMIGTRCLVGLSLGALLAGPALWPEAAQAQERRFFQVTPGPRTEPPRLDTSLSTGGGRLQQVMVMDRASIARWLCPNGGTPARGRPGRCDGRGVARGGAGTGVDADVAGWHADLAPASHRQLACPLGTVPTPARFNPGTVRCMPGAPADAAAKPEEAGKPVEAARAASAAPPAAAPPASPAPQPSSPQAAAAGAPAGPSGS